MDWSEVSGGLLQAAPDAILVMDADSVVLVNDQAEAMFGWSRANLIGQPATVLLTDASVLAYPEQLTRRLDHPQPGLMGRVSLTAKRQDGTEFPTEASLATVDTESGRLIVAVIRDLTERNRLLVEAQTHRNQRLEGLGQLAGGIAHDFNNMLGVIMNYASFVIEEAESDAPDLATIIADAHQVTRAGDRATELTHQLLAFARREVVRPEVLDLNALVAGQEDSLRRSLGDRVTLIVRPAPSLPPVTCDPGQIEQLLVNLAVNAGDAMPSGGNLVLDTAAVTVKPGDPAATPGEYVRLRLCDTGRGMTPDVAERAFEPFFTTKPSGEGTGLGLATVYGIVTQADGFVTVESSPGLGTTVTVLLPAGARVHGQAPPVAPSPAQTLPRAGSGETLLVVEDEAALRDVAGRILSGAGYHVLAADGGIHALELAALHEGAIDLLLSDVVMPGMLGKELAERLGELRPDTRVLFMSGYAQPVLASQGTLEPGVALLEKPFTAADLLRAVRHRLDG